jgi:hypothetical protein
MNPAELERKVMSCFFIGIFIVFEKGKAALMPMLGVLLQN